MRDPVGEVGVRVEVAETELRDLAGGGVEVVCGMRADSGSGVVFAILCKLPPGGRCRGHFLEALKRLGFWAVGVRVYLCTTSRSPLTGELSA